MTWDIDVGFRSQPQDLEWFLVRQGYKRTSETGKEPVVYEHLLNGWPTLSFTPSFKQEQEPEFNWEERTGRRITSHLNINFHLDQDVEARRLANAFLEIYMVAVHVPSEGDDDPVVYLPGEQLE